MSRIKFPNIYLKKESAYNILTISINCVSHITKHACVCKMC